MDTEAFWRSVDRGKLLVQRCQDCANVQFYPRSHCVSCHGRNLDWQASSGAGVIYSYTVVRRAPSPQFAADVPYVLALVQLSEGPRVMVRLTGCEIAELRVGTRVSIAGPGNASQRRLPPFRPAAA